MENCLESDTITDLHTTGREVKKLQKRIAILGMTLTLIAAVALSFAKPDPATQNSCGGVSRAIVYDVMLKNAAVVAAIAEDYRGSHNGKYPSFTILDSLTIDNNFEGLQVVAVSLTETQSTKDTAGQSWTISYWVCPETSEWFQLTLWGYESEKIGVVNNFAEKQE